MNHSQGTEVCLSTSAHNVIHLMNSRTAAGDAESPPPQPVRPYSVNSGNSTSSVPSVNYINYNYYVTNNNKHYKRPHSAHPSGRNFKMRDDNNLSSVEKADWIPPRAGTGSLFSRIPVMRNDMTDRCKSPFVKSFKSPAVRTPHPPSVSRQRPPNRNTNKRVLKSTKEVQSSGVYSVFERYVAERNNESLCSEVVAAIDRAREAQRSATRYRKSVCDKRLRRRYFMKWISYQTNKKNKQNNTYQSSLRDSNSTSLNSNRVEDVSDEEFLSQFIRTAQKTKSASELMYEVIAERRRSTVLNLAIILERQLGIHINEDEEQVTVEQLLVNREVSDVNKLTNFITSDQRDFDRMSEINISNYYSSGGSVKQQRKKKKQKPFTKETLRETTWWEDDKTRRLWLLKLLRNQRPLSKNTKKKAAADRYAITLPPSTSYQGSALQSVKGTKQKYKTKWRNKCLKQCNSEQYPLKAKETDQMIKNFYHFAWDRRIQRNTQSNPPLVALVRIRRNAELSLLESYFNQIVRSVLERVTCRRLLNKQFSILRARTSRIVLQRCYRKLKLVVAMRNTALDMKKVLLMKYLQKLETWTSRQVELRSLRTIAVKKMIKILFKIRFNSYWNWRHFIRIRQETRQRDVVISDFFSSLVKESNYRGHPFEDPTLFDKNYSLVLLQLKKEIVAGKILWRMNKAASKVLRRTSFAKLLKYSTERIQIRQTTKTTRRIRKEAARRDENSYISRDLRKLERNKKLIFMRKYFDELVRFQKRSHAIRKIQRTIRVTILQKDFTDILKILIEKGRLHRGYCRCHGAPKSVCESLSGEK